MCLSTEVPQFTTREVYLIAIASINLTPYFWQNKRCRGCHWWRLWFLFLYAGEESLTIFVDKRKLSKRSDGSDPSTNSSVVTLETLHQLAASYFIDRDSTLRRLHHIQIASTAIKVWGFCWDKHMDVFLDSLAALRERRISNSKQRLIRKITMFLWITLFCFILLFFFYVNQSIKFVKEMIV